MRTTNCATGAPQYVCTKLQTSLNFTHAFLYILPEFNRHQVTPEVAEATAAHLAAVAAASGDRRKREADPAIIAGGSRIISAPTPLIHNAPLAVGYAGLGYHGLGYAGLGYGALGYGYGLGLGYHGLY